MSHTPGPWSVQGPYGASHGREWEISTKDGHGVWTARCQNASDAALVAMAPELLACLRRMCGMYGAYSRLLARLHAEDDGTVWTFERANSLALEAIAKAEDRRLPLRHGWTISSRDFGWCSF